MTRIILFASCLIISLLSKAQWDLKKIDEHATRAMQTFSQPGMSLALINNGKVFFEKGYGSKRVDNEALVDEHTVFQLASLSKAFTAAGIGILVDRKALRWDDRVCDQLPGFKLYDPIVSRLFTVRDLLCHRNGYETFDGDLLWYGTMYDRREIVKRFSQLAPKHGFREKYGYSNIMFIAAALLIEEKSGMSWEDFMEENILKPLQMNESSARFETFINSKNKAHPHVAGKVQEYINYNNAVGAVGINSSVHDLTRWAKMWLSKGELDGKRILSEATVHEIFSAKTLMNVSPKAMSNGTHFKAAASGWFVQDHKGELIMHHSGGLPGFILNLVLIPEKNSAIICLSNGETLIPFALTQTYLDELVIGNSKDYIAEYAPKPELKDTKPEKIITYKPDWPDSLLLGQFEDLMYGKARIYKQDKKLMLELSPTAALFTAELIPAGPARFSFRFKDPFLPSGTLICHFNAKGAIDRFTIDLPNPDFNFYNLNFIRQSTK